MKEKLKEYRNNNKEMISELKKKHYLKNKERINEAQKVYYRKNKEKILEHQKVYHLKKNQKKNENYVPRKKYYSWRDRGLTRIYFDSLAILFNISEMTDWYRISMGQIRKAGGMIKFPRAW